MAGPLGCPDSYTVAFCDNRGEQPWGEHVEPSQVDWSRALDDTSDATVTVPLRGPDCCATLGAVRSWCHDMSIYRDTALVWQGPVVGVTHTPGHAEITAHDVSAWLARRELISRHDYTATGAGAADLAVIAEAIVRDAFSRHDPNVLPFLQVLPSGIAGERDYKPGEAYALDELNELARTGLDWTALGHRLVVFGERALGRLPQLGDDDFLGNLQVIEDGLSAANRAIVHGEGVTGTAQVQAACGLLTRIVKEQSIKDQASADAEARAIVESVWPPPLIVNVPSGAQLAPDAPVGIMDLVPGMVAAVTSSGTCRTVNTDLRLTKLQVSFTPRNGESVKVTMAPPGVETALSAV